MRLAYVLAAFSGLAGLAHQTLWTRRLVDLLGASPLTFSKVLGAFFLGLAAGSALAALRSGPVRRPWRRVAFVELVIAVLALPALLTPQLTEWLYQSPRLGVWLKHLVPFLFVTPPAVAMGLVIPWVIRALSTGLSAPGNAAARLYAANTFGGVLGLAAVLLVALPVLGLTGAGLAVCGVNVLVAVAALGLDASQHRETGPVPRSGRPLHRVDEPSEPPFRPTFNLPLLAFGSGFLALALEVVMQHQFAQVAVNSLFSSATVLAWVLLALAAGSAVVPWLAKRGASTAALLRLVLLATAALCAVQPFLFFWMRDGVHILAYELPRLGYLWEVSKLGLVTLCPVFLVAGLVFPLLLREAVSGSPAAFGRRVALLLAWNGVGGWIGAETAQHLVAPNFGLWQSVVVIGLGYGSLALSLRSAVEFQTTNAATRSLRWLPVPVGALAVAAWFGAGSLAQVSLKPGERLAALRVGHEGVVATVECGPDDWRMLFNNSYTLGGSKARFNQERQSHLPILLHGDARSVGVLGVATGSTVAGAAAHPDVERVDAAELSPLVLGYAREHFGPYNREVARDPRVRLLPEDARWMVATRSEAYDVVIGDLFLPWRTGEGRLYSLEHFRAVRHSLKPGGVFCQWLPMFQLTRPQFEAIARTFQRVFPDVLVVRGDFYTELPILGLIGGRDLAGIDWTRVERRCEALKETGKVTDPLARHAEGVAMMIVGQLPALPNGPVNTLANAWLEWDCARNIPGLKTPWFIGVPEAEFVRDLHRQSQSNMPPPLRPAHDAGQYFLTLEIATKLNLAVQPNLFAQLLTRLPAPLRNDPDALWQEWPSRAKPPLPGPLTKTSPPVAQTHRIP
jgi:spermidine synthase